MKLQLFSNIWLVFANISASDGFDFNDLIDYEQYEKKSYLGAYANILIKANIINEALEIVNRGLSELHFKALFVDKIANFKSLVEYDEVGENIIEEAKWLINSEFVFKISDKLFPYTSLEEE
jgi:hypothetical protein